MLAFLLLKPFLVAIFLGALLAYLCYPLYVRLQRKIKYQSLAAFCICLLVLIVVGVVATFFIRSLIQESVVLYVLAKQRLATGVFSDCANSFCDGLKAISKDPQVNYHIQNIVKFVTNAIIQKGTDFFLTVPKLLLNVFVIFFSMFYFLKDGERFLQKLREYLYFQKYDYILQRFKSIIHGVVFGYLFVAFLQGLFGALGFFLFGFSSPLFWGMVMAILALIPLLGTGVVWVPASLFLFLEGVFQDSTSLMLKGVAFFVYSLIFVGSLDNVLRPKLIGEKAKIHPVLIMLGIFGGILLLGPIGVLIGPLVLSLIAVLVEVYGG